MTSGARASKGHRLWRTQCCGFVHPDLILLACGFRLLPDLAHAPLPQLHPYSLYICALLQDVHWSAHKYGALLLLLRALLPRT